MIALNLRHFTEHLGGVIYDGIWSAAIQSPKSTVSAKISSTHAQDQSPGRPLSRGCFADSYDWRDGIGPTDKRPAAQLLGRHGNHHFGTNELFTSAN